MLVALPPVSHSHTRMRMMIHHQLLPQPQLPPHPQELQPIVYPLLFKKRLAVAAAAAVTAATVRRRMYYSHSRRHSRSVRRCSAAR